jgi:hypothetical protein
MAGRRRSRQRETWQKDLQIDSVCGSEDIQPGPARLVVIGINPGPSLDIGVLRATVEKARVQCVAAAVAAILHGEDASLVKTLRALGVVGVVQQSASLAIAVAAVRLMMVGGVFLPPEPMCEQSPPLTTHWTRQTGSVGPRHLSLSDDASIAEVAARESRLRDGMPRRAAGAESALRRLNRAPTDDANHYRAGAGAPISNR